MNVEKRRYKIVGFRDCGQTVRIILDPAELVKKPQKQQMGFQDMMQNPMGAAQQMMGNQMNQMIHDTFSITKEEYMNHKYTVGEIIIVSIVREG